MVENVMIETLGEPQLRHENEIPRGSCGILRPYLGSVACSNRSKSRPVFLTYIKQSPTSYVVLLYANKC